MLSGKTQSSNHAFKKSTVHKKTHVAHLTQLILQSQISPELQVDSQHLNLGFSGESDDSPVL